MNPPQLQRLHDFVQPPPPSWMPQTIGWYALLTMLAIAVLWRTARLLKEWKRNRYRREALHELPNTPLQDLSSLLKRTALAAWPRQRVAALTGDSWLRFLNDTGEETGFASAPGDKLEDVALANASALPQADEDELRRRAADWIRGHHARA